MSPEYATPMGILLLVVLGLLRLLFKQSDALAKFAASDRGDEDRRALADSVPPPVRRRHRSRHDTPPDDEDTDP